MEIANGVELKYGKSKFTINQTNFRCSDKIKPLVGAIGNYNTGKSFLISKLLDSYYR